MSFDARTRILIVQSEVVSQRPADIHRENASKKCAVYEMEFVEYDVRVIEHGTSFLLVGHVLNVCGHGVHVHTMNAQGREGDKTITGVRRENPELGSDGETNHRVTMRKCH